MKIADVVFYAVIVAVQCAVYADDDVSLIDGVPYMLHGKWVTGLDNCIDGFGCTDSLGFASIAIGLSKNIGSSQLTYRPFVRGQVNWSDNDMRPWENKVVGWFAPLYLRYKLTKPDWGFVEGGCWLRVTSERGGDHFSDQICGGQIIFGGNNARDFLFTPGYDPQPLP